MIDNRKTYALCAMLVAYVLIMRVTGGTVDIAIVTAFIGLITMALRHAVAKVQNQGAPKQ